MELFRIKKDIPFMRHALIFNVISALTFVAAVFFLFHKGLHFSVEFTGGTVMEVSYSKAADVDTVRKTVESLGYVDVPVQTFGKAQDVVIRLPLPKEISADDQAKKVFTALQAIDPDVKLQRTEQVGSQVGDELAHDGLMALLFVVIGVVIYLAIRFEWKFAVAAIIANLHDVIIILGFFAFFQWEFNLSVLAAVLAVLGYSVNESVVIFDRIRENFRLLRKTSTEDIMNISINETLSRTIMTSLTVILVLSALFFLGGEVIHNFSLALLFGVFFGTYSSIFIASPMSLILGISPEDLMVPIKEGADIDTMP